MTDLNRVDLTEAAGGLPGATDLDTGPVRDAVRQMPERRLGLDDVPAFSEAMTAVKALETATEEVKVAAARQADM